MIVTLTMNPSVDRTAQLPAPLAVGGVNRIATVDDSPGGKGVNVARVVAAGGVEARAVFPAPPEDPFVTIMAARPRFRGCPARRRAGRAGASR